MRVMCVAGARPNFMKVAPILEALSERRHASILVHTGQHYDLSMSGTFLEDLGISPDFSLEVGSGTHAQQTAKVMERFEPILEKTRPDWVVVMGDVNSTMACALVTAKLRHELNCGLAHVEAGLRSYDWRMPEEVNRVVTDRVADLLLTPSADAESNLAREGLQDRVIFVGNVMIDTLLRQLPAARALGMPERLGLTRGRYVLCTVHRPSNVDDSQAFAALLEALRRVGREMPVVLPIHPRTRKRASQFGFDRYLSEFTIMSPVGYREMLSLTDGAAAVLTDSGGIQEETTVLGVPCVTLREQTERPITLTHGTNRLAPWPLTAEGVVSSFREAIGWGRSRVGERAPDGWDGCAAERIVAALERMQVTYGVGCPITASGDAT